MVLFFLGIGISGNGIGLLSGKHAVIQEINEPQTKYVALRQLECIIEIVSKIRSYIIIEVGDIILPTQHHFATRSKNPTVKQVDSKGVEVAVYVTSCLGIGLGEAIKTRCAKRPIIIEAIKLSVGRIAPVMAHAAIGRHPRIERIR